MTKKWGKVQEALLESNAAWNQAEKYIVKTTEEKTKCSDALFRAMDILATTLTVEKELVRSPIIQPILDKNQIIGLEIQYQDSPEIEKYLMTLEDISE